MKFFRKRPPWIWISPGLGYLDSKQAKKCKDPIHNEVGNHDLCGLKNNLDD